MKWFAGRRPIPLLAAVVATSAIVGSALSARSQNRFTLQENQFNQWLYNNNNGKALDEDSELSLTVEALDRTCRLTEAQKEKLRLAGRGDYARFKQEIEQLRSELVGKSYDQNEMGNIYQRIQPLNVRYNAGLLGETSLFSKLVHSTLTSEQRDEYEAAELARRQSIHDAKARLFVANFERSCPLTAKQRDAFVKLVLAETRPAKRSSEYDWYVVVCQVGKIPDQKVTEILDEAQMHVLKKFTAQARGMERHLKQIGVMPDEG
jgi:hypothetical protein